MVQGNDGSSWIICKRSKWQPLCQWPHLARIRTSSKPDLIDMLPAFGCGLYGLPGLNAG